MFDPKVLSQIALEHRRDLEVLANVEKELNRRFLNMEEPIRALMLAVASGEPLVFIGPPGTAKSRLVRAFCGIVGLLNEDNLGEAHPGYFDYLLTPFTEPGELFGFYDVGLALKGGALKRVDKNMMQKATVVYLDEIFNGSSAILNSILTFLNERIFHDRGERHQVKMEVFFSSTNNVPETPELRAVFDRLVLRCHIDNVEARTEPVSKMLRAAWIETYGRQRQNVQGANDLLNAMKGLRETILDRSLKKQLIPDLSSTGVAGVLASMVGYARDYELSDVSNRRLVKMLYLMVVHRIYDAVKSKDIGLELSLREQELRLFPRCFLDRYDEEAIRQLEGVASRANI